MHDRVSFHRFVSIVFALVGVVYQVAAGQTMTRIDTNTTIDDTFPSDEWVLEIVDGDSPPTIVDFVIGGRIARRTHVRDSSRFRINGGIKSERGTLSIGVEAFNLGQVWMLDGLIESEDGPAAKLNDDAYLHMTGGSFIARESGAGIEAYDVSRVDIFGGIVDGDDEGHGIEAAGMSEVSIFGGQVKSDGGWGVFARELAQVTLAGGTIVAENDRNGILAQDSARVTVVGGTIGTLGSGSQSVSARMNSEVVISGGEVNNGWIEALESGSVTLEGGLFGNASRVRALDTGVITVIGFDLTQSEESKRLSGRFPDGTRFDVAFETFDQGSIELWDLNLSTYIGDANLDGEFNAADIVDVLVAGEYVDKPPHNSTWGTGDWNGDGDFTSTDLILALGDGGYEAGPRPAAVPESTTFVLLMLGAINYILARKNCFRPRQFDAGLRSSDGQKYGH